ncbi:MAG: hypothetical protein WAL94_12290 [Bacteroidales bacterium]
MTHKPGFFDFKEIGNVLLMTCLTLAFYSCASLTSPDYTKRIQAVNKLTDQNTLYKVASTDSNLEVRIAALNRISDQNILYKMAMEEKDPKVRLIAFNGISDQNLINNLAVMSTDKELQLSAITKVTDQDILHKIALKNMLTEVRMAAFNRITDQNIINNLAVASPDAKMRLKAIATVSDQDLLYRIVLDDPNTEIKMTALGRISDQVIIKKFALESKYENIRLVAIHNLTDEDALYKIALGNNSPIIREAAMNRLKPEMLAKLATDFSDIELKLGVIALLNDQAELMKITLNNNDWTVRQAAFRKLNDNSLQSMISEGKDPAVILASRIRLGLVTWNEAFSVETNTKGDLGNVIGAAALVDLPKPTSYDVVEACHNFIKRGDASRIPELISLLNRFGDVSLAEDYLNCGNEKLYSAGADWGRAHGYDIGEGYGSHRVQWGEKR